MTTADHKQTRQATRDIEGYAYYGQRIVTGRKDRSLVPLLVLLWASVPGLIAWAMHIADSVDKFAMVHPWMLPLMGVTLIVTTFSGCLWLAYYLKSTFQM